MIKKSKVKFKDGTTKTQIRVVEGVRVGNNIKHKHIRNFGYLEDNIDQEAFLKMVKEFDEEYKSQKRITIELNSTASWLENRDNRVYNFGYIFIESIYDKLELNKFFSKIKSSSKYSLNEIFKFLVILRILKPDSKRATFQQKDLLFNKEFDFELHDIYRALSTYSKQSTEIQKHLNNKIKEIIGRNEENTFYDTTNYHFEIDFEDEDEYKELEEKVTDKKEIKKRKIFELKIDGKIKQFELIKEGFRKKGVSKQHHITPIVQMSLMIDTNSLPICMSMFPGNTNDGKTLFPTISKIKKEFDLKRLIIIADKGINSSDNIDYIVNNGDGYLFSQTLRGKKGYRYHERLFNDELYTVIDEDNKYQIFEEEYEGKDSEGKKVIRKRKVLLYYNGKDARRTKKKRDDKVEKVKKAISGGYAFVSHSKEKYITKKAMVGETGELADTVSIELDEQKIKDEELFDGYGCIITSELEYDHKKIRETYKGLWRIEESFKITKDNIYSEAIYLGTEEHIKGHFMTCFVALLLIRMLQLKLDFKLSAERIIRALNFCCCIKITNEVVQLVQNDSFLDYKTKITQDGNKIPTLALDDTGETIQDVRLIFETFNIAEYNLFNRIDKFITQLSKITYKK